MAEAAERFSYADYESGPGQAVPLEVVPPPPERFEGARERAAHAAAATMQSIRNAYWRSQTHAVDAFEKIASSSRQAGSRVRNRAQYMIQESPLQALAVVGGLAFAIGVMARIRRSHHA